MTVGCPVVLKPGLSQTYAHAPTWEQSKSTTDMRTPMTDMRTPLLVSKQTYLSTDMRTPMTDMCTPLPGSKQTYLITDMRTLNTDICTHPYLGDDGVNELAVLNRGGGHHTGGGVHG